MAPNNQDQASLPPRAVVGWCAVDQYNIPSVLLAALVRISSLKSTTYLITSVSTLHRTYRNNEERRVGRRWVRTWGKMAGRWNRWTSLDSVTPVRYPLKIDRESLSMERCREVPKGTAKYLFIQFIHVVY